MPETALTIQEIDRSKIDLMKKTVAKGTTDLEFELFLHACKRTGLDPLMKQIYAIKRRNKDGGEDMSIQTGIDGYRLIADRTGQYAGSDEPTYLLGEDGFPDVASVTVYKLVGGLRCAFSSSARWKEYYSESSPMWKKMPFLMIGKCAEALALRKAFPAELSGVYTHEEMQQADAPEIVTDSNKSFVQKFPAQAKAIQEKIAAGTEFIWSVPGKNVAKPISAIDGPYLVWYEKNGKDSVHVKEAIAELDRRDARQAAVDGLGEPKKGKLRESVDAEIARREEPRTQDELPPKDETGDQAQVDQIFEVMSAIKGYETAFADANDLDVMQYTWDEIVKDPRLTAKERTGLYGTYQRATKRLTGKGK